jgi:oligopeptide transport system permease protein
VAVIVVTFFLMHLAPGSPWDRTPAGSAVTPRLSPSAIRNLNARYGTDQPLLWQLLRYLGSAARFDFGQSYQYQGQSVASLIRQGWSNSAVLGVVSFVVVASAGLSAGVVAGLKANSRLDYLVSGFASLAASVPNFVVGVFLISGLSVGLHRVTDGRFYLPDGGFGLDDHLVMPVATVALLPIAYLARLTRASVVETLQMDHVAYARARGLRPRRVLWRYVLKNSVMVPLSALGPILAFLLTGSVVVEDLFQIRGIGGLFVGAVGARDYPVILATSVVYTVAFSTVNLLADLAYLVVDPRVRVA